jgi:antitoxin component YwqK of YwqJK toxin-antitoxin module
MEQMMERVMRGQEEFMQDQRRINQQVADQINDLSMKIDLLTTQGKMLETQVTQLATPPARQQDMQREHVKAVFSRNECEEGKTKPPENETEQEITREISYFQKQVKEDVPMYVPPLTFVPFPQRLVKPDFI